MDNSYTINAGVLHKQLALSTLCNFEGHVEVVRKLHIVFSTHFFCLYPLPPPLSPSNTRTHSILLPPSVYCATVTTTET